ncbi:MAG: hypothetical protein V4568_09925, partial [Pseudomonadota bacterium]
MDAHENDDLPENEKKELTLDDYRERFFSLQSVVERQRWTLAVISYYEKSESLSGEGALKVAQELRAELEVEKEDRALLELLHNHIQNSAANNGDPEHTLTEGVKVFSQVAAHIKSRSDFFKRARQAILTELEKPTHDNSILEHLALVTHTLSAKRPYVEWLDVKRLEKETLQNLFTHSSSLSLPDRLRTWTHVGRLRALNSKLFHDTCHAIGAELQKCKPDEFSGSDLRHLAVLIDTFRSAGLEKSATSLAQRVAEIVAASDASKLTPLFAPSDGDKKNFADTAALIADTLAKSTSSDNLGAFAFLAESLHPFANSPACRHSLSYIVAVKLASPRRFLPTTNYPSDEFRDSDLRHLAVLISACRSAGLEQHAKSVIKKVGEIIAAQGAKGLGSLCVSAAYVTNTWTRD